LPPGTRGYRVEFEIADSDVLLSDFELWHYVLNYWYLPASKNEGDRFNARYGGDRYSWRRPPTNHQVTKMISDSWDRIFDRGIVRSRVLRSERKVAYPAEG
jgi:hypothetical protein